MLFSIVTVNRNNAKGLERTIKSVIAQDRRLYEYIIIDGASNDGSLDVITRYKQYIDYYVSEPDSGIYNAMNKGIARANGEYTIFMNSSDEFAFPEVLNKVLENGMDTDFIFGGWIRLNTHKYYKACLPPQKLTLYMMYYNSACICHQATFTKTSILRELGGYEESLRISADICFVMKALEVHHKSYKPYFEHITHFDINGMSGKSENLKIINDEKTEYFRKLFPYVYDDYTRMHNILRFSPANILRFIKWKLSKNK